MGDMQRGLFRFSGVPLPDEETRSRFMASLASLRIDGKEEPELEGYLRQDLDRFLLTLALVPDDLSGQALEVGANPYFISTLVRDHRPNLSLDLVNYFAKARRKIKQRVQWSSVDGAAKDWLALSRNVNVETSRIPVKDGTYDLVLFCEVLEHMTNDPLQAVRELWRVIKPGGLLVLTTPNVCRLDNVLALLDGRNLYDPYSGYGPYGRHNREYTRHELHELMTHAGFEADVMFTSDVHPNLVGRFQPDDALALLAKFPNREHDLGQYHFTRWRKAGQPTTGRPAWLYRSYPAGELA